MKTKKRLVHATLASVALGGFVLACPALAVFPPPDGGYPGFNTAEGQNALFNLTTGAANTAVGWFSLFSDTAGSFNTATGAGTLLFNTADQNTAFGTAALLFNTIGFQNTANGTAALLSNTEGNGNTATGVNALRSNTNGDFNTATGGAALANNTEGGGNTATGTLALSSNMTGNTNTAIGFAALQNNTASDNTAIGAGALNSNTTGASNTAVGAQSLATNTTGQGNTAIGLNALLNNTTGTGNIALGGAAGEQLTTGDDNIDIGNNGQFSDTRTIRIGEVQTKTFIAGIRGVTTGMANAIPVLIDSLGQLGTMSSSRRFKHEIKAMDSASEAIHSLKPVTFHYKSDATRTPQFGLIAEEVAEVNRDLVVCGANGEIYSVRYEAVNAMLLNEFLKEHRTVQEQKAIVAQLKQDFQSRLAEQQKQIEALASALQKVSAQIDVSKAAPQVVNNR
jgi:Chaperone of endosialidase